MIVDDHLLNYPSSDLIDVLTGKKSFQQALNSPLQGQAEFLNRELMTCSLYLDLTSKAHENGDWDSAARAIAYAENGYATVLPFLSHPQGSKYLTIKVTQEFTATMKGLRKTLDDLARAIGKNLSASLG